MLAMDKNQRFRVVLKSDEGREKPPTFVFRYLTAREFAQAAQLAEKISTASDNLEALQIEAEIINAGLVCVENAPEGFDRENLADFLTVGEMAELMEKFQRQGIGAAELKNSESPAA